MKVDFVFPEFFSWSWNAGYGMCRAAEELGILGRLVNVSSCSQRRILDIPDTDADCVIFLGGCEHSQRLLDSQEKVELISGMSVPTVAIIYESFGYDEEDLAVFPNIGRHRDDSVEHGRFFSHLITSDELDVPALRAALPDKSVTWLPQCADVDMFRPLGQSSMNSSVFVGNLYPKRKRSIADFRRCGLEISSARVGTGASQPRRKWRRKLDRSKDKILRRIPLLSEFYSEYVCDEQAQRKEMDTQLLNKIYNDALLNVNLPGPHKGLTSRVFEVMAAGGLLLQPKPIGRPNSAELFRDGEELVYYEDGNPCEGYERMSRVLQTPSLAQDMAVAARNAIVSKHSCLKRLEEILDFVAA